MSESVKLLTCKERDALLGDYTDWEVAASLTDPHGNFGTPTITTTWARDLERLEDIRHPHYGEYAPGPEGDAEPCEHYYWIEEQEQNDE